MPTSSRSTKTAFSTPQVCPQAGSVLPGSSCWATFRCSTPVCSATLTFTGVVRWWCSADPRTALKAFDLLLSRALYWNLARIPSLQLFILGKCFLSTLNIWMAGCALRLQRLKNERGRETFICACAQTLKSMLGCLFVGTSLRGSNPKVVHQMCDSSFSSVAPALQNWRNFPDKARGK